MQGASEKKYELLRNEIWIAKLRGLGCNALRNRISPAQIGSELCHLRVDENAARLVDMLDYRLFKLLLLPVASGEQRFSLSIHFEGEVVSPLRFVDRLIRFNHSFIVFVMIFKSVLSTP